MEWKDKIARLFRRKPDWKKEHRRTLIARHAENLLRERDIRSMTDLVRRHRKSDLTIAGIGLTMNTATSRFLRTPEDAAGKDMLELMDALRRTSFAKKIGRRLADVPADTAHSLHGLLAMHTFLLDAYLEQHPDSKLQQPPMDEVQAAAHIVDRQFRAETFRELDARLVRMTGRQSYADDLFESLRRKGPKPEKHASGVRQKEIDSTRKEQTGQPASGRRIKR